MTNNRSPLPALLLSWLRTAAWIGVLALAYLSLAPSDLSPPRTRLPGEVEHFIAYAFVSALAVTAFWRSVPLWILGATIIGYAALLEKAQNWSSDRSTKLVDFVASAGGAMTGIVVGVALLSTLAWLCRLARRQRG